MQSSAFPARALSLPKVLDNLAAFLVLLLLAGTVAVLRQCGQDRVDGPVVVMDGDSLRVGGLEVRLSGFDAPELHQTCLKDNRPYACGEVAKSELAHLVAGQAVSCRIEGKDRYGRSLGRCSAEGDDIGRRMVRQGFAVAYGGYAAEEAEARRERLGLWAGSFEAPSEWRKRNPVPHRPRS